jgi:starch phosphorylase
MSEFERTETNERFGAFVDALTERDSISGQHKAQLHELRERLSRKNAAIVYASMEVYDREENDLKGGGGLGILAGDTRRVYEELGIPEVVLTPFYTEESHQTLQDFWQIERLDATDPNRLYQHMGNVAVATGGDSRVHLDVFERDLGSTRILTVTEPNFGELYPGGNSGNHRLYQEISLGFGGYKALKNAGIEPVFTQLNEAPTVFLSLAHIDDAVLQGATLEDALATVRAQTLFTNHTLVPAVEGEFGLAQFEHFVMPNIESAELKEWITSLFNEQNRLRLSLLAAEVSGVQSGVSKLHAEVADYYHASGDKVEFHAVTHGISQKWIHPEIYEAFRNQGVLDEFGLPTPDYLTAIDTFDIVTVRTLKQAAKDEMNRILAERVDQYGQPIYIPDTAVTFDFKRRFASYKRPNMPFEQPDVLARILAEHDGHFLLTGKPHPNDDGMKDELHRILQLIDGHPVLRDRVHYVVDYDEEVGRALALGADIALNLPVVGEEACGTSWMKDIANFKVLISTPDGGVADVVPIECLEVSGDEQQAVYTQMANAATIVRDDKKYLAEVKRELGAYIETISGARMAADYLDLLALASLKNNR